MSTSVAGQEVRAYLEAVRSHLAYVPVEDRDELLEDLEDHLLEVAAEDDGTLEQRLGPASTYAEELRTSPGLSGPDDSGSRRVIERMATRLVRTPVWRSMSSFAESAAGRTTREFILELRPGWWVLRGYVGVLAATAIAGDYPGPGTASFRDHLPLPLHDGQLIAGFFGVVGATAFSVWLGRRGERSRRARRFSIIVSLSVVVAILGAIGGWGGDGPYYDPDNGVAYEVTTPHLHHADGTTIANICPYAADGKLLTGVLLFDQFGRPITNTADSVDDRAIEQAKPAILNVYPKTISVVEFLPEMIYDPATDTAQQQKRLTPLECPTAVTAGPAQPSPIPSTRP